MIERKDFEKILKPLQLLDFPIIDSDLFDEYYDRARNFSEWIIRGAVKLIIDNETRFPKPAVFFVYIFRARDELGSKVKSGYNKNWQVFICQTELDRITKRKCGIRFLILNDGEDKEIVCRCERIYHKNYLKKCYDTQMEITDNYATEIYLGYPNPNDFLLKELKVAKLIDEFRKPIELTDYVKKLKEELK